MKASFKVLLYQSYIASFSIDISSQFIDNFYCLSKFSFSLFVFFDELFFPLFEIIVNLIYLSVMQLVRILSGKPLISKLRNKVVNLSLLLDNTLGLSHVWEHQRCSFITI